MATNLSHSESRRLYSWWWDSHNTPKNSKWLQQNITDMDGKVKCMIKLIEEDADSFARRAEMYYKKRPELMKLVEEFYRAYRALAERYNHATGELRHAHKTIAAAFPDQVPFDLLEDPGTLETNEGVPSVCAITSNEPHKGLKQLQEMFGHETSPQGSASTEIRSRIGHKDKEESCQDDVVQLLREIKDLKDKILSETERAGRAEGEAHGLKKALSDMEAAKEDIRLQYQLCLKKVQETEGALHHAQTDSARLTEKASRAEIEAQTLKEALIQLESVKNGEVVQNKENLKKISHLEAMASQLQDEAGVLKKQAERAEIEVSELKQAVLNLNKQKEASALQYGRCLEKISELEKDILSAKGEVEHLNHRILIGSSKLKTTEERSAILEMSNQALRVEAEDLAKKIAVKDQELSSKQEELKCLQSGLDDESARRAQVEATLDTLQNLHSQSQDDQRALAMELKNMLQMLQGVDGSKRGLKEDIELARDGNYNLKEIRERLEKEVLRYTSISVSLQHEISCLKEEIELLNKNHQALVDENFRLKKMHEESTNEREVLLKKLESIDNVLKKKVAAERCLSELNNELEISRENVKALQESYHLFNGEKAALTAEKASLLSQLQAVIENMNNLSGQNAVLENSLSSAKVELEGLREKSKGLEEICSLLKNERSHLLSERDSLVLKLEHVERRLGSLEKKFSHLGEKYADLEKENKAMHSQVEKLEASLGEEKQERIGTQLMSETRMAGLETEIHLLQEENRSKKKESDEELEKSLKAQFEISIFQKFIQDMENKNYSLIIECQKHVEASKMAEKVISELESESLEQQVEAELLLDEIGRLRLSIYQIFTALDCAPKEEKVENEQTVVQQILESVEDMKCAVSNNEDEKQQLVVENSILEALLEQLRSKGIEIESQKQSLEEEAAIMAEKLAILENEKQELLEMNGQLKTESSNGYQAAAVLQAALMSLCVKHGDLQTAYNALQNTYSQAQQENACLLLKFSDLLEEKHQADDHNDDILVEFLATANQSAFLKSFISEKTMELRSLLEDLNRQHETNSCLGIEMNDLGGKLDLQKAENLVLREGVCRLEREIQEVRECNAQMKQDIESSAERLIQTKTKLFDTEMQLEATEKLNSTLFTTVAELKIDMQRSQQVREDLEQNMAHLSKTNSTQTKQIQSLHNANTNLESELSLLHQEIEENVVREQTLSIELQGMNNEFELWEAEAATFCFDLQVSSVQEVLLKNKVQELTGVCQALEHQNAAKMSEFEEMKGKVCVMESEIDRLKSRLSAYDPVVASLRDDVMLIEQNALIHSKLKATHSQEMEFLEFLVDPSEATSQTEDQSLLSLQNLQMRVKAVGKLMDDTTKPLLRRRLKSKSKQEPVISEVDRSIKKAYMSELNDSPKLQKTKAKASEVREVRNVMLMKDIPLDQASDNSMRKAGNAVGSDDVMLELWETVEDGNRDHQTIRESLRKPRRSKGRDRACDQPEYMKGKSELPSTDSDMERELAIDKLELSSRFTEPYQDLNDKDILERLAFDAEKLEMLQTTLYDMRIKLETYKKSKKAKSIDFGAVKEQLQEADDTLVHLIDLNVQLVKNIEECPPEEMASPRLKETMKTWRIKVMEQAEKGSERINMLELAVQKIQFVLSKIEDEGKNKFLKSRTVILRDFIHSGRKNSGRRKKGSNCGCFKQSTSGSRSRS